MVPLTRLVVRRTVDDHLIVLDDADIPSHIAIAEAMRHDLPWEAPDLADALDELRGQPVTIEIRGAASDPAGRAVRLVHDLLERRGGLDEAVVTTAD